MKLHSTYDTSSLPNFQNESALDLADMDPGDQAVLDMADHPPAPTTAASDGLESAITIYTPGVLYIHCINSFNKFNFVSCDNVISKVGLGTRTLFMGDFCPLN